MSKQDLEQELAVLIKDITGKEIPSDLYEEHFFSNSIKLTPFFLVYLFFAIQDKFEVEFSKEDIIETELTSVSKIAALLQKKEI